MHIDDAWLGEHAYFQSKLGYVKSNFMEGLTLQEIRVLCHHKLMTLQGALVIDTFGFGLFLLKGISLVYFTIFLLLSFNYLKDKFSSTYIYLFYLLLFGSPLVFEFAFVFRPEIPLMTIGFSLYLVLERLKNNPENGNYLAAFGGLLAGIGFSTHLNGVIFLLAGITVLCLSKRYRKVVFFVIGFLPGAAVYFYDYRSLEDFNFFVFQVYNSPLVEKIEGNFVLSILTRIVEEHLRFFHSPPEIIISIILVFSVVLLYKRKMEDQTLMHYFLALALFLAIFSANKTSKYVIIFIPYIFIIYLNAIQTVRKFEYKNAFTFIVLFGVLYFSIGIICEFNLIKSRYSNDRYADAFKKCFINDFKSCSIVAPMQLIFYGYNKFKSIQSQLLYTELQKSDKSITGIQFLERTRSFGIDFAMVSDTYIDQLGLLNLSKKECESHGFEKIYDAENIRIYKNLNGGCVQH